MEPIGFWSVLARMGWEPAAIGLLLLVVAWFVLSVGRGRLVPRSNVEDMRKDLNARVDDIAEERDTWRQAYTTTTTQLEKLLAQGSVTNELINSLRLEAQK